MRRSLIFSTSIISAALLVMAPLAASPVTLAVTSAPVVQKEKSSDSDVVNEAFKKIQNSFKGNDTDITNPALWNKYASQSSKITGVTQPTDLFDSKVPGSFANLNDGTKSVTINNDLSNIFQIDTSKNSLKLTAAEQQALTDSGIKFTSKLAVVDAKGVNYVVGDGIESGEVQATAQDFEQNVKKIITDGGSLQLTYQFYRGKDESGNFKTFHDPITVKLQFQNPVVAEDGIEAVITPTKSAAKVSDKLADYLPTSADDLKFENDTDGNLDNSNLNYYVDLSRDIKDSAGNIISGDKFTKPGDYTRAVTIDFKSMIGPNYQKNLENGKIKIKLAGKEITLKDGVANFDAKNGKYSYNQLITVTGTAISDDNKEPVIKDDPVTGVVNVKESSNAAVVPLYDPQGRIIIDRSLPVKSSWRTDSLRTINGVKYYRVSTEEYVKASQVSFDDYSAAQINVGVISGGFIKNSIDNIFQVTGVGLTGLWRISDDGKSIIAKDNRWLAQNSLWYTDQRAVIAGITFYRVSTNEWVKANSGNLIKQE